jgi:hypothetical protein
MYLASIFSENQKAADFFRTPLLKKGWPITHEK